MTDHGVSLENVDLLDFDKGGGLIPALVQHARGGGVLMLGYMNRAALIETLTRKRVVFFSRARGRLWEKGETSGHSLELEEIRRDCDSDTLLVLAYPKGPVCHTGRDSCFGNAASIGNDSHALLATLEGVIDDRYANRPEGSYTAKLLSAGLRRVAQKVGEEGLEVALAATGGNQQELVHEAADLIYHLLVLLRVRDVKLEQVLRELESRHTQTK